jgi:sugar/nucleoside kinase (ribokinase family)
MSVDYSGEFRAAVSGHLADNDVIWSPLQVASGLSFFRAVLDELGNVVDESFAGEESLTLLTPEALAVKASLISRSGVVVTCTDLPEQTLRWLRRATRAAGVPFWLLSSSLIEVEKFNMGGDPADCVSLNFAEFTALCGQAPFTLANVLRAARKIVAVGGQCVVTLGRGGSLLVDLSAGDVYHQPTPATKLGGSPLGAGDVLFGCLLVARLQGMSWREALYEATGRTARYLSREADAERPYLYLKECAIEPPLGRTCHDDESLGLLASARD